ncbi:hypothetical protein KIW84_012301 [Lathyrus oleraceus]|uniref:Uncharacterized protein n=1 Tax=Pisum sativum TaxID=3888 RepID=A0A9D5BHB9_PEA|nr:hypothetical protein KIW84_012301 [Pisum sativum]
MDEGMIQILQSRHLGDDVNVIVLVFKTPERVVIQFDNSNNVNNRPVSPLVIRLAGPVSYVVSIADVTHNGRVFGSVFPKNMEDCSVGKKVEMPAVYPVSAPKCPSGESNILKPNNDDEVFRLIKKSEFNMVERLLQTPSKISVLSLLMNSEAHREAL